MKQLADPHSFAGQHIAQERKLIFSHHIRHVQIGDRHVDPSPVFLFPDLPDLPGQVLRHSLGQSVVELIFFLRFPKSCTWLEQFIKHPVLPLYGNPDPTVISPHIIIRAGIEPFKIQLL